MSTERFQQLDLAELNYGGDEIIGLLQNLLLRSFLLSFIRGTESSWSLKNAPIAGKKSRSRKAAISN